MLAALLSFEKPLRDEEKEQLRGWVADIKYRHGPHPTFPIVFLPEENEPVYRTLFLKTSFARQFLLAYDVDFFVPVGRERPMFHIYTFGADSLQSGIRYYTGDQESDRRGTIRCTAMLGRENLLFRFLRFWRVLDRWVNKYFPQNPWDNEREPHVTDQVEELFVTH